MDFRQLESFVTIVKHNSFTRAARELYLTQPTLTGHIQALENELGTVIFNRNGKNITLTDAGRILYNHAVNILNMREQAVYSLAQYEGRLEGELAIASSSVPQKYLLPPLLKDFSDIYPGISYIIRQFDSKGVVDCILSGDMDFGLVGADISHPGLQNIDLCPDQLVLIAPNSGRFSGYRGKTLSWDQVKDEKFILREEGSGTRELFFKALEKKGIGEKDIRIIAQIENIQTINLCVRAGLGVSVVSERSVKEEVELGMLKAFYLEGLELKRKFHFVYHKNRVLSPLARAFKDFLADYYG